MTFRNTLCALSLMLLFTVGTAAHAMTMARLGDTMVMTGEVVPDDVRLFKLKLAERPLKRVILLDSKGGSIGAAYSIAAMMRDKQVSTVVAGRCMSACAVIFMGGVERQMMDGKTLPQTRLGFHGPHNRDNKALSPREADKLESWLERMSGGKFSGEPLERAMRIARTGDMLFFYYPEPDTAATASVVFCDEGASDRETCKPYPGVNALDAGVLTTRALFQPATAVNADAPAGTPATAPASGQK